MFTCHARTKKGTRILVIGVGDTDIDAMRSAEQSIISVQHSARVDETVVIFGTEQYILGRLETMGLWIGEIQRSSPPPGERQH